MAPIIGNQPTRIAIVGAGNVGSTFAYTLMLSGLASEIVMLDTNLSKAEGEVMDLNHSVPMTSPTKIWAGDYKDCAGAVVTVITAGSAQKPGESRLDLVQRNANIFKQMIPEVAKYNPEGIILIATNPVDVLTYTAIKLSGLSPSRVIGSGTILDTARFRYLLSEHLGVDPRSVHAFIIGEHGDSEVPVWSLANVAGMHLPDFCRLNGRGCGDEEQERIFQETRDAAYRIIERKGSTYYAIGASLLRLVEAILRNQNTVFSISSYIEDYYGISDVCLSIPSIVDRGGVEKVIMLDLNQREIDGLRGSAEVLKGIIRQLKL
jgi:L-lactate dehydrogenase